MHLPNRTSLALALTFALVAPTFGLLVPTALAQGEDIRVVAVYDDFARVPDDFSFSSAGITPGYRFAAIPGIIVGGPSSKLEALRGDPALASIVYDEPVEFLLETAVVASRARDVWGTVWHAGSGVVPLLKDGVPLDGRGVTVGVVDTGTNAMHPDLWYAPFALADGVTPAPKVLACVHVTFLTGPSNPVPNPDCDEQGGHGTHVSGIVAGTGMMADMGFTIDGAAEYNGAAPGAQLAVAGLGVETIAQGGLIIDGLAGLDWQYATAELYGTRVVTNSWSSAPTCTGGWNRDNDAYHAIVNKLVLDKGITVLWAANNNGVSQTLGTSMQSRHALPGVISVANYDDAGTGTRNGKINAGSGDGCVKSGGSATDMIWTFPDVAAPGTNIVSTAGGTLGAVGGALSLDGPLYASLTGTSMATPLVAGVAALMYQAYPDITPAQVEKILIETAMPWTDTVGSRGVAGTAPYWGPSTLNNANAGFTDKTACRITPEIAARAEANDPTLDATYPGFREMVQPRVVNGHAVDADAFLYVCRDFKRGHGLVDAHAAVLRALALAGGDDPDGTPEIKITVPDVGETIDDAQMVVEGLVDRVGEGPNAAPTATLAASTTNGPAPLDVDFSLAGFDSDGAIVGYTLDFGDESAIESGSTLPTGVVQHTYVDEGGYTAKLTVTDDEGASGDSTLTITVGGLPATHELVTGTMHAYYTVPGSGAGLDPWVLTGLALGLAEQDNVVPFYAPGQAVRLSARGVTSTDGGIPVDLDTTASIFIFEADGTIAAGPIATQARDDTNAVTGTFAVEFSGGEFVLPVDWAGRYLLGLRIDEPGGPAFMTDRVSGGHAPIDVIGSDSVGVPGLPGTEPGGDEGHSIGDADDDGLSPYGEILWVDTAADSQYVTTVTKLAMVPQQPAGDSIFLYNMFVNGVRFESYVFGGFGVFDVTNGAVVTGAQTAWDTTENTVTIRIPLDYLAGLGEICPCTGHVEAMVGEGLLGGVLTVDRAPDAGERDLRAAWQRNLPTVALGSPSDPENTDPEGEAFIGVGSPLPPTTIVPVPPHVDVTKVWVSRETPTEIDLTLEVSDLASAPPSVDAGNPTRASWNYGIDFCVDNADQTYTATGGNFAGVTGVVCYRLSAANSVLGVQHSGGGIQKDGSGSCGVTGLTKGAAFNNAASTVTWTVDLTLMTVRTISAGVGDCTTAPQVRDAPAPISGNVLSRFSGRTGFSGPVVTLIVDDSTASAARPYTLGGDAPALVANAGGSYAGRVDKTIAISGSATGGTPPYSCAWSASGASFVDAGACTTGVLFTSAGAKTLTLTVTDDASETAVATASVAVAADAVERVEVVVGGLVQTSATVATSGAQPTATWSVIADVSGLPNGPTDIVATWYDADGTTVLATTTRTVTLALDASLAFVDIESPEMDAVVSGTTAVTGIAGFTEGDSGGSGMQATNAHGFPHLSGMVGPRAGATFTGTIDLPCAACQPGRLQKPLDQIPNAVWNPISNQVLSILDNNLGTSVAWLDGPESAAHGLDGYWFNVAGFGGSSFVLSDEFGVATDIRFFSDWLDAQSAELGGVNGDAMPKNGMVPETANWAFTYVRRGSDPEMAANQWGASLTLDLTPVIVLPGPVQGLAATSGAGTVALSWSPPLANGGELLGYKIMRDGDVLGTQATTGFVDTPGDVATHVYAVLAYNSAGESAPVAVSAAASGTTTSVAITSPLDGAVGVPATTAISGTYTPNGDDGEGGAFANTHYFAVLNLNDNGCGDPLGYGDHVIFERLTRHAVDVLGVPAANVHVYNELGGALARSVDAPNYDKVSSSWQSGGEFDGAARWSLIEPALRQAASSAAAGEAAGGAPARIFFLESSHGIMASIALGDGVTDSVFCLVDTDVSSTMLGDLLNDIDADVAAAHEGVAIEWSINVDCSFCGGFADSPLPAPSTSAAWTAGVVGPNRVVEVGCAWVTECFGNPAVTYDYMFNECVFTGKADGYGPLVVSGVPGSDGGDVGNELIVGDPNASPPDGVITLEESYWCAIETSHAPPFDPIAIQQMFQISDNLQTDMFGRDGFVLWEKDSSLDLREQAPDAQLDTSELALPDVRASDPVDDSFTPYSDLVSIEASATATDVLVTVGVADLSLSAMELEDVIEYRIDINGQAFGACYAALSGGPLLYDYGADGVASGSVVYDTANGLVHFTIPVSSLLTAVLPAEVFASSHYGECSAIMPVADDRVPDAGSVVTSESGDPVVDPGADKVTVELSGPAIVTGVATLDGANGTWSFQPTSPLGAGTWTATAAYLHDAGSGFVQHGEAASITFSVGISSDVTPPTAPGQPVVTGTTSSTISLSWTASTDDVGVARYEILRDDDVVGETSATSFVDGSLAAGTTYAYVVKAYDAAGNHASSAPTTATTDEPQPESGTVTLRIGTTLLGSADVDLSDASSAPWSIVVDWNLLPEGPATLVADFSDGAGRSASDSVEITISQGVTITITTPEPFADVLPTFTVAGAVEGAGGPDGFDTSTYMLSNGEINKLHLGFALAQSGGLAAADAALRDAPGYLGVAPDLVGAPVVKAYFSGSAPSAPEGVLPAGWTLEMVEDVTFERAIQKIEGPLPVVRAREGPPVPSQSSGIGPGSHIFQQRPDGLYSCTANFVWKDTRGEYYLGAAGHCFLPEDKTATHGPGADYNPALTTVRVCVSACTNGGQTGFIVQGTTVPLGPVAYARQTAASGDVGNDFGLVKIPQSLYDQVRPEMPVWNGPTTQGSLSIGEPAVLYGNAVATGEVWPTMARAGFGSVFGSASYWSAVLPSAPGDSGSALLSGGATGADNVLEGIEAIGALTHLSGAGPVVGTTMSRSIAMAAEASLTVTPVLQGQIVAPPEPTVPSAPVLETLSPGTTTMGVTWLAPENDGNSPITGYVIHYTTGSTTQTKSVGAVTSASVTGLTPAATYRFTVSAVNAVGEGPQSNELEASTQALPTPPTAPRNLGGVVGNGYVTLGWDAPESDGGSPITGYTVNFAGSTSGSVTKASDERTATISGLRNGDTYTFHVVAHNEAGTSPASNTVDLAPDGPPPPSYTIEVRVDAAEAELVAWTPVDEFDGSTFSIELSGLPGGAATVSARVLADGVPVRTTMVDVHVLSPPELTLPATTGGFEKELLEFTATATDVDTTEGLTFSIVSAPEGAGIDAETGRFSWLPEYGDAGSHLVTLRATDRDGLSDDATTTIDIVASNRPPVLQSIGNQIVDEGGELTFTLTATDHEDDPLTFSASELPTGATFDAANATFSWTPGFDQRGNYEVTFRVTDGRHVVSEKVTISVGDVPLPPDLLPIGPKSGMENALLTFRLEATDEEDAPVTFGADTLPEGATLDPVTGVFAWTPTYTQAGVYPITFSVTDGTFAVTEETTITILNVDRAPVLQSVPAKSVLQLATLSVPLTATDADGDTITWSVSGPEGVSIVDDGNGKATLRFEPTLDLLGPYPVEVTATAGDLSASRTTTLTVVFKAALTMTAISPASTSVTPGENVTLRALLTNTGPNADTFRVKVTNTWGWKIGPYPETVSLGPGESQEIAVDVTSERAKPLTLTTISATSMGDGTTTRSVGLRVLIPVLVEVEMDESPTPEVELPAGLVRVRFVDGSLAQGVSVSVSQTPTRLGTSYDSNTMGTTDAMGEFRFDFTRDARAMMPDTHILHVAARVPGSLDTLVTMQYRILL